MNKPQTITEVLELVDQKLSSEDKWTQGSYARDKFGIKKPENDPSAYCYCIVGAVISVTEEDLYPGIANKLGSNTIEFLNSIVKNDYNFECIGDCITKWNDDISRTFNEVKQLISCAKYKSELLDFATNSDD